MRLDKKLALFLVIGALFVVGMACTRDAVSPAGQASGTAEPPKKFLSQFSQVTGTQILVAGVYQGEERSGLDFSLSSGRDYSYYVYNYIFFDLDSEQFQPLFPENNQIILNKIGLPFDNSETPIKLWLYSVVKADTNQDDKLSDRDQFVLALSDVNGKNYIELIPNIDETLGQFMKSESVLLFFYRQGEKKYYAKIDLTSRSVLATTEYPSFGADVK